MLFAFSAIATQPICKCNNGQTEYSAYTQQCCPESTSYIKEYAMVCTSFFTCPVLTNLLSVLFISAFTTRNITTCQRLHLAVKHWVLQAMGLSVLSEVRLGQKTH